MQLVADLSVVGRAPALVGARRTARRLARRRMVTSGACYVCHEPCTSRSHCACEAHVHTQCLLKSAIACNSEECTICRRPISNLKIVRVHSRASVGEDPLAPELLFLCVCSLFFSAMALLFFAASTEQLEHCAYAYAGCCVGSLGAASLASRMAVVRTVDPITVESHSRLAMLL